jgi:hypothetical protein
MQKGIRQKNRGLKMAGRSTAYKLALQEAKAETAQYVVTLRDGEKKKPNQSVHRGGIKQDVQEGQPTQETRGGKD